MHDSNKNFRGNARHLSALSRAAGSGNMASWNTFARQQGSSFRARLAGADLSGMILSEIKLDGADLSDANLEGTNLSRANLSGARLRGANLAAADLSSARLDHADLSNAQLSGATLQGIRARGANFSGANLSGTQLDGADLTKTSIAGISLNTPVRSTSKTRVRVKVRSKTNDENHAPEGSRNWRLALSEEEQLKRLREEREKSMAAAEKERLDRKLGRRKPLFNRVK